MVKRMGIVLVLGVSLPALLAGNGRGQDAKASKDAEYKAQVLSLSQRIDQQIEATWPKAGITGAPLAPDTTYFRRLNLDLTGKIPTLLDIRDFIDDDNPAKRWLWVERFLEGEYFPRHFAAVWRNTIIGGTNSQQVQGLLPQFEVWLRQQFQSGAGYDQLVKGLITSGPNPNPYLSGFQQPGSLPGSPAAFYFANENKAENLAGATARVFLGVKLECAQCHAHPFAKWTREQFWEFAAFFGSVRQTPAPGGVPQPVINPGRKILIPGTSKTVNAKYLTGVEPAWKEGDDARKVLADWIVTKDNPFFARATVDLVWQYFFGTSLLEPIVEPSDDHPITHPQLLDELAREFTAHNYDLKFLIRAIVHTRAYQRSSATHAKASKDDYWFFARMPVRGMTPEQVFDSFAEASEYVDPVGPAMNPQAFFNQQRTPRGQFLAMFASQDKRHETHTSILQALFLMNGKFVAERTNPDINASLHTIATANPPPPGPPTTSAKRIETLVLMTLSRYPRPEETERLVRYFESGGPTGDRRKALADIYWALINSGEFLLNH